MTGAGPFDEAAQGRSIFHSFGPKQVRPRVSTMLRDLFGRGRDGKRPDTKAAAAGLGVSQRTVQRWIKDGPPKNSASLSQLRSRWQDSPAGRRRQLDPATRQKLSQRQIVGGQAYGRIYISQDRRNGSPRGFTFALEGEDARAMLEAMQNGDDAAAYNAWLDGISKGFGGSVDQLEIEELRWDQ